MTMPQASQMTSMPAAPAAPAPEGDALSQMGLAPAPSPALQSLLVGAPSASVAGLSPAAPPPAMTPDQPGQFGAPGPQAPDPSTLADSTAYDPAMMQAIDIDIRQDFQRRHGRQPTNFEVAAVHALPMIELNLGRKPTRVEMLQYLSARDETPLAEPPVFTIASPGVGVPSAQ